MDFIPRPDRLIFSSLSESNKHEAISTLAFESLYINYRPALVALVSRHLADVQMIEDIVQNAFIKIWINFHHYDERKAGVYAWITAICRNEMIDYFRSAKRKLVFVEMTSDRMTDDTSDIYNKLDVARFISTLDEDDCNTITFFMNGFTYDQVSQIKNLPIGSAKTKVRRIVKTLRRDFS